MDTASSASYLDLHFEFDNDGLLRTKKSVDLMFIHQLILVILTIGIVLPVNDTYNISINNKSKCFIYVKK
jgi:hypothetical protein